MRRTTDLKRTSRLRATRRVRRDQGQRAVPSTADCGTLFRVWCRENLPQVCAKCGRGATDAEPLEVSHFFNVRKSGVRYEPANVDMLHSYCHTGQVGESWEYKKGLNQEYEVHMACKLGEAGFQRLQDLARSHVSLEEAKTEFIQRLREGTLCENRFSG